MVPDETLYALKDLIKENAISFLIALRAKGNIPYTESLDFIRRLSTVIELVISCM